MKRQAIAVCLFLISLAIFSLYPLGVTAQTLSEPTVTVPSNWYLTSDSTAYPNKEGVHDSTGSGLLEYFQNSYLGMVEIYFEKTYTSYTSTELANEALSLYNSWSSASTNAKNPGQITSFYVGGWIAGCYRGTSDDGTTNYLVVVFVANGYYIDIYSTYPPNSDTGREALDLIGSINVPIIPSDSGTPNNSTPYYYTGYDYTSIAELVIIAIIVIVIVVVIAVAVRRRKPKKEPEQQAAIRLEPVLIH